MNNHTPFCALSNRSKLMYHGNAICTCLPNDRRSKIIDNLVSAIYVAVFGSLLAYVIAQSF